MTSLLASSWCAFSTSQPSYSLRCQYVQVFLPPHVRCLLPWMPPLLFAGLIWQHIQHMHMYIIHILDYNSLCVQILRIFKMFASKSSHSNSTVNWVTVVTYIFFLFLGGGGEEDGLHHISEQLNWAWCIYHSFTSEHTSTFVSVFFNFVSSYFQMIEWDTITH